MATKKSAETTIVTDTDSAPAAIAPVAAEIMAGRPPAKAMTTAIENEA